MSNLIINSEGRIDSLAMRKESSTGRILANNSALPYDAFKHWDDALHEVTRRKLTIVPDLKEFGLIDNSLTLGDIETSYEMLGDFTPATISMDGDTRGDLDRLTFTDSGVPIPIYQKSFKLGERNILSVASRPGRNLPDAGIRTAGRMVAEAVDSTIWNGWGHVVNSKTLYGLTNHPHRKTTTVANAWRGSSASPVTDVQNMIRALHENEYARDANTCALYVASNLMTYLDNDYSDVKGTMTLKQRIEALNPIRSVKHGSGLKDNEMVLIEMDREVLELKVAQDFTWYEEVSTDKLVHNYKSMAAMALIIKPDSNGRSGIAHASLA